MLASALLAGLLLLALAGPARAADVYWGANIGEHLTGGSPPYDMNAADQFEGMVGKQMSIIHFVQAWGDCSATPCTLRKFPAKQMEAVRQRGAIPLFGWVSFSTPQTTSSQPDFQLRDVIAGNYDAYIRQWAQDAKAWGHPFFLDLNPEMNLGSTWPYVEERNDNRPGEYVKMWRHVHDIFRAEGVQNATWTWCANIEFPGSAPLAPLYPGDEYVDWTCMDGYNWYWGWKTPGEVFGATYDKIQGIAPDKPVLIGETASTEKGGSKAGWIRDFLGNQLPRRLPNVKGFVWYEKKDALVKADPDGWLIESSESARAAFAAGIASPYFAEPAFKDLPGTTIQPLSPLVKPKPGGSSGGSTGGGTGGGSTKKAREAALVATRAFAIRKVATCLPRPATLRLRYRRPSSMVVTHFDVYVDGKRVVHRIGRTARRTVVLKRLPNRAFRLSVKLRTSTGKAGSLKRTFRVCA